MTNRLIVNILFCLVFKGVALSAAPPKIIEIKLQFSAESKVSSKHWLEFSPTGKYLGITIQTGRLHYLTQVFVVQSGQLYNSFTHSVLERTTSHGHGGMYKFSSSNDEFLLALNSGHVSVIKLDKQNPIFEKIASFDHNNFEGQIDFVSSKDSNDFTGFANVNLTAKGFNSFEFSKSEKVLNYRFDCPSDEDMQCICMGPGNPIYAVASSRNIEDSTIQLFKLSNGAFKHSITMQFEKKPIDTVSRMCFDKTGRYFAVGTQSEKFYLYDIASESAILSQFSKTSQRAITALTFTDNNCIAYGVDKPGNGGNVVIVNYQQKNHVASFSADTRAIQNIAYDTNTGYMATVGLDNVIAIWDISGLR